MTPQVIFDLSKRTCHFGQPGVADQVQTDLLRHFNARRFALWRRHAWDWSLDDVSLSVSSSDYNKTLASTSGQVYELAIQGERDSWLRRYSRREYLKWQKSANASDPGYIFGYVHLGRDSSGNLKLRFISAPSTAVTVEGWAKKRISALTSADLATELTYFPEEMHDILLAYSIADCYLLKGEKEMAVAKERAADAMVKNLVGDEESPPDEEPRSLPPDYMMHKARRRGGGSGVY